VADVDPPHQRGDVERERALADRLDETGVGAGAALVAGYVQARRIAPGELAQRVEVGGVGLARDEGGESR
jgi:hypothetical protein